MRCGDSLCLLLQGKTVLVHVSGLEVLGISGSLGRDFRSSQTQARDRDAIAIIGR